MQCFMEKDPVQSLFFAAFVTPDFQPQRFDFT